MKVTPISGDMAVKLTIGLIAVGGVAFLILNLKSKISTGAGVLVQAINPASPDNVIYQTVNSSFGSSDGAGANADGSWTLGGWLFDVTHPGTTAAISNLTNSDPNHATHF